MLSIVQAISRGSKRVIAVGIIASLGYAAVAGRFATFTRPAEVATFLPGAAVMTIALIRPSHPPVTPNRSAWIVWLAILALATAVELAALFGGADHAHPTISDLVNPWIDHRWSRAGAFALWLGAGGWLLRRG